MVNKLVHLDADSETTRESFTAPNDSYNYSHMATWNVINIKELKSVHTVAM